MSGTRQERFAADVKAQAIAWIEANVTDETATVFVATDRGSEWWSFTSHSFDQSALVSLLGRISGAAVQIKQRLRDALESAIASLEAK